jgi:hypothetical protein
VSATVLALLLAAASPEPAPPALRFEPPPPPPEETVRVRSPLWGTAIGAVIGAAAGVALTVGLCDRSAEFPERPLCGGTANFVKWSTIIGLAGAAVGAVGGSIVGAGVPGSRSAGHQARLWERASGEIGELSLHVGSTRVVGRQGVGGISGAIRATFLTRFGDVFAVGPELGYFPQRRRDGHGDNTWEADHAALLLGGAVRVGVPFGRLYPYATVGVGQYIGLYPLGTSFGVGADWRLMPRLSLVAEARLHGEDGLDEPFANLTAGVGWHW